MVVRARRRLWVMVKGAGGHCRLCTVGSSLLSSPVSLHGHWASVVGGGGWLWLSLAGGGLFLGHGCCFRGRSASSWSNDSLGHVLACDVACHVIVIVVGGGCEWMAMVVGGGGCWQWW